VQDITHQVTLIHGNLTEQANVSNEINTGLSQITEVVNTNISSSEEAAGSSSQLSAQAQRLKDMTGNFVL
jgi:methyl-accepting chemotaxis protein